LLLNDKSILCIDLIRAQFDVQKDLYLSDETWSRHCSVNNIIQKNNSMFRACSHCDKLTKNINELKQYLVKYEVLVHKQSWTRLKSRCSLIIILTFNVDQWKKINDVADIRLTEDIEQKNCQWLNSKADNKLHEVSDMLNSINDERQSVFILKEEKYASDEDWASIQTEFIRVESRLLSTSLIIWVESFKKTIEKRAAMIINISVMISEERSRKHWRRCDDLYITKYHFFQNKTDYVFALWLYQTRITKENVHKYFNDIWLHSLHSSLSFQTSDEWLNLLHRISYNIDNEQWQSRAFCILFMYEEANAVQYDIKYQNIIESLYFLLKHRLFEKDLIYALVHHYNMNNCRVYNEMHMINWWWKTQKKLSDDIIIVLLLLITDKTVLTQHQSNLVAWSFYLIIENLF